MQGTRDTDKRKADIAPTLSSNNLEDRQEKDGIQRTTILFIFVTCSLLLF